MQVYEAQGELMAATTMKVPLQLPESATYDEYLSHPPAPNVEATVPLNLSSGFSGTAADGAAKEAHNNARAPAQERMSTASASASREAVMDPGSHVLEGTSSSDNSANGGDAAGKGGVRRRLPRLPGRHKAASSGASGAASPSGSGVGAGGTSTSLPTNGHDKSAQDAVRKRAAGSGRKVKARLWLANKVPINQRQLVPLLDIMSTQNQYIGKVRTVPQLLDPL